MAADETEFATPTLMSAARGVYAQSIRSQLRAIDAEDLPRNCAVVLAGLYEGEQRELPGWLGISDEALDRAVDELVGRGYVSRPDGAGHALADGIEITSRGRQVIEATARGVERIDGALAQSLGQERLDAARQVLLAMAQLKRANQVDGSGLRRLRTPRQLRSLSPIFPVRDLAAALTHYRTLGFATMPYAGGSDYGFADRDGVGLHLAHDPDHGPGHGSGMAYLYVSDANALHAEWSRAGVGGHTRPVETTEYGLREGSHVDPDGNLIRFGSPVDEPLQ